MNIEFFDQKVEAVIVKELLQWSRDVLEKPNAYFNDLPPCPYAKQAWAEDRVAILFKYDNSYQTLYKCISEFDDGFDLAIIVDLADKKSAEDFHEYLYDLNTVISEGMFIDRDIWLMGFHPEDEENEFVEDIDFEPLTDTEYSLIFIQRLSKVQKSADSLVKTGYYDTYKNEYNAQELMDRRKQLYRRLKNGDAT
jgi:hypothetical protein